MAYTPQSNPQPTGAVTVTTPGAPVQLTKAMQSVVVGSGYMVGSSSDIVPCNKINLNAIPANVGSVYIGQQTMVRATLAGVIAVLAKNTGVSITNNVSMNIYDLSKLYVDADNGSDGIYGSIDTV